MSMLYKIYMLGLTTNWKQGGVTKLENMTFFQTATAIMKAIDSKSTCLGVKMLLCLKVILVSNN